MTRFVARRVLPLPPDEAFALVTDLTRHDRWIPLTRVQGPAGPPRAGARYSALSAGVLRDRMVLTDLRPPSGADDGVPAVATDVKRGPVLLGSSTLTVRPCGRRGAPSSSLVTWSYDAWLAGPPPWLTRRLVSALGMAMAAHALRRIEHALRS